MIDFNTSMTGGDSSLSLYEQDELPHHVCFDGSGPNVCEEERGNAGKAGRAEIRTLSTICTMFNQLYEREVT